VATFGIVHLAVQVLKLPGFAGDLILPESYQAWHVQVWPPTPIVRIWPPNRVMDTAALTEFERRFAEITVLDVVSSDEGGSTSLGWPRRTGG
jgi:hypothetical protein